jgi:hypothetical protein
VADEASREKPVTRFSVRSQYETVCIYSLSDGTQRVIGSFWGSPLATAISDDEVWAIAVGKGTISCRIEDVMASEKPGSREIWTQGQTYDGIWFLDVKSLGGPVFLLTSRSPEQVVREYILNAENRTLVVECEWKDTERIEFIKERTAQFDSFRGHQLQRVEVTDDHFVFDFGLPDLFIRVATSAAVSIWAGPTVNIDTSDHRPNSELHGFLQTFAGKEATAYPPHDGGLSIYTVRAEGPATPGVEIPHYIHGHYISVHPSTEPGAWSIVTPHGNIDSSVFPFSLKAPEGRDL